MKLLPKNSKEEYTAILGIESASTVDEGQYTCHVSDWGVQECKSVYLEVQGPPLVQVSPMSVSLKKVVIYTNMRACLLMTLFNH